MSPTVESLGLAGLPFQQKIQLANDLWQRAVAEAPPGFFMSDELRAELQRRIKDAEENPDDSFPAEQVRAEARAMLGLRR